MSCFIKLIANRVFGGGVIQPPLKVFDCPWGKTESEKRQIKLAAVSIEICMLRVLLYVVLRRGAALFTKKLKINTSSTKRRPGLEKGTNDLLHLREAANHSATYVPHTYRVSMQSRYDIRFLLQNTYMTHTKII